GDGGQIAGHFGGERGLPRGDEGVIGGLEVSGAVQVKIAAAKRGGEEHRTDGGDDGTAAQEAAPAFLACGLRLPCFRRNGWGRLLVFRSRFSGSRAFVFGGDGWRAFDAIVHPLVAFQNIVFEHASRSCCLSRHLRNETMSFRYET